MEHTQRQIVYAARVDLDVPNSRHETCSVSFYLVRWKRRIFDLCASLDAENYGVN